MLDIRAGVRLVLNLVGQGSASMAVVPRQQAAWNGLCLLHGEFQALTWALCAPSKPTKWSFRSGYSLAEIDPMRSVGKVESGRSQSLNA